MVSGRPILAAAGLFFGGLLVGSSPGASRDGTARDTVMFSILATEWRDVKRHLELRLARHR